MNIIKSKHYLVDTDIELLDNLVKQLEEVEICNFGQLISQLRQLQIADFNDLLQYLSSAKCNDQLAILSEEVLERLRLAIPDRESVLTSSNEVGTYLANKLAGRKQEELWAIYIDNSNHIIAEKKLFKGTLDKSVVHPREIFRWAMIYACAGIFVVHNHPSGNVAPSQSDLKLTKMLQKGADLLQIDFLDHFIVGKGHYVSLREHEVF
ncbi:DNA repair protein RadC [Lactobacillus sp. ESL0684]|uniref:JAB domain-containing protein n=1 Tax=Lactobacillus sp. ESL0684 TaxID=2983213 RepID=UPI0023F94E58|nr:DNA repair protein RadC [Lactobacillus sp. ESL0684]WEV42905.1 DNA repair protein RadC [Lactobacillus sp. ESL0684]